MYYAYSCVPIAIENYNNNVNIKQIIVEMYTLLQYL